GVQDGGDARRANSNREQIGAGHMAATAAPARGGRQERAGSAGGVALLDARVVDLLARVKPLAASERPQKLCCLVPSRALTRSICRRVDLQPRSGWIAEPGVAQRTPHAVSDGLRAEVSNFSPWSPVLRFLRAALATRVRRLVRAARVLPGSVR